MRAPLATAVSAASAGAPWHRTLHRASDLDGWLGTPQFPGYRAGHIIARLSYLPLVAADQLYLDVLLLDSAGRIGDAIGGVCASLGVGAAPRARSRFVCVTAELLRHVGTDALRFSAIGQTVAQLREFGVDRGPLMAAAKLLDIVCSEASVVESLLDMLVLSLGEEDAERSVVEIQARLVRNRTISGDHQCDDGCTLREHLALLVRSLGKHRARHILRMGTMFDLVPEVEMYGGL